MKTAANLRERQKVKRAKDILGAAAIEFGERGFDDARIEDIAARAEVAPGTVYNYFGDKNGILIAMFSERLADQKERLIAAARKPFKDVLAAVDHYLDAAALLAHPSENSDLFRRIYAASFLREASHLSSFVAEDDNLFHDELIELFVRHRARGTVPASIAPKDLADIVFAIGTFHWMRWINGEVEKIRDVTPEMKRHCRLAVAGICGLDVGGPRLARDGGGRQ